MRNCNKSYISIKFRKSKWSRWKRHSTLQRIYTSKIMVCSMLIYRLLAQWEITICTLTKVIRHCQRPEFLKRRKLSQKRIQIISFRYPRNRFHKKRNTSKSQISTSLVITLSRILSNKVRTRARSMPRVSKQVQICVHAHT